MCTIDCGRTWLAPQRRGLPGSPPSRIWTGSQRWRRNRSSGGRCGRFFANGALHCSYRCIKNRPADPARAFSPHRRLFRWCDLWLRPGDAHRTVLERSENLCALSSGIFVAAGGDGRAERHVHGGSITVFTILDESPAFKSVSSAHGTASTTSREQTTTSTRSSHRRTASPEHLRKPDIRVSPSRVGSCRLTERF